MIRQLLIALIFVVVLTIIPPATNADRRSKYLVFIYISLIKTKNKIINEMFSFIHYLTIISHNVSSLKVNRNVFNCCDKHFY